MAGLPESGGFHFFARFGHAGQILAGAFFDEVEASFPNGLGVYHFRAHGDGACAGLEEVARRLQVDPAGGNHGDVRERALQGFDVTRAALAGSALYVTNQSRSLYAIDLASGKENWHFQTRSSVQSSPVVSNGIVYFGSNDGGVYAIRVDGGLPMQRAVYWDAETAKLSPGTDYAAVRDSFHARGYDVVNAATLGPWLAKRISDRAPSVVVFATDILPTPVGGADPARGPFRRYLDSGGKAVWIGDPPLLDRVTGENNVTFSWDDASKLVGVPYRGALMDDLNDNRATSAGRDWGLAEWWLGTWEIGRAHV